MDACSEGFTIFADKDGTVKTESFSFIAGSTSFTLNFNFVMNFLQSIEIEFQAVDKEGSFKFLYTSLWEGGLFATFCAGEGFVGGCSEGQSQDTLFTVVVKTSEDLRLCIVLLTDRASDFFLQLF